MTTSYEVPGAASTRQPNEPRSHSISYFNAFGIALFFSSGFFYRLSLPAEAYLIDSLWVALVLPTVVSVFILAALLRVAAALLARDRFPHTLEIACCGLAALLLVGLRGLISICGYSFNEIIGIISITPWSRDAVWLTKLTVLFLTWVGLFATLRAIACRGGFERITRFAAALGYSIFCLAAFNVAHLQNGTPAARAQPAAVGSAEHARHRRVVWIIFDELDYRLALGDQVRQPLAELRHFRQLAQHGISANQAYSPSDATATSIPALLMGRSTTGARYLGSANYQLRGLSHEHTAFTEANSVFGRLPGNNSTFSILGFYQPYCQIFISASTCNANPTAPYEWYQGLIDWVPWPLLRPLINDPMYVTSAQQVGLLPSFLARRVDALTFIHLNVPHLSSHYASQHFGQSPSSNMQVQYLVNLRFADEILGQVIDSLQLVGAEQDVLLIVSGDHGFRMFKDRPDESRPVPWIAWRVGADAPQGITAPISTVHTAALIEQFLNNKVDSQSEIAQWWQGKQVLPRLALSPKNHDD